MGDLLVTAYRFYYWLRDPDRYERKSGGQRPPAAKHTAIAPMIDSLRKSALNKVLYDWLDSIRKIPRLMMIGTIPVMRADNDSGASIQPWMVIAFLKGVKYLDAVSLMD